MRFKNVAYVIYNTYNDFGELEADSESEMKCLVLKHKKQNDMADNDYRYQYDLKIMVSYKTFSPYSDLFNSDMLKIKYDDTIYLPKVVTAINNFSGKTKYYELDCTEELNT